MSNLTQKIDLAELDVQIRERKPVGMSEENALRVEEIVFTAYYNHIEAGHITIDRFLKPNEKESQDTYFTDLDSKPPKPRPRLFYMGTKDEYKGNSIAGILIKFANEFYKSRYETPLHSGTINAPEAIRVWEKLVSCGDAIEYLYENKRRWRLL